jgi:hypothetical protein
MPSKAHRIARKAGKMAKMTQFTYFPEKRFQGLLMASSGQ